jgi:hypothetical protein
VPSCWPRVVLLLLLPLFPALGSLINGVVEVAEEAEVLVVVAGEVEVQHLGELEML